MIMNVEIKLEFVFELQMNSHVKTHPRADTRFFLSTSS
jgi:hypothetical protein